jgi:hypothetical protein
MRKKNLILRYFGLGFLLLGIALNIKMYVNQEWPTYIFYVLGFIGAIQIIFSLTLGAINKGWQIFWSLLPFLLVFLFLRIWFPTTVT